MWKRRYELEEPLHIFDLDHVDADFFCNNFGLDAVHDLLLCFGGLFVFFEEVFAVCFGLKGLHNYINFIMCLW